MSFLTRLSSLSPVQFENLIYDCVRAIGVRNLVWRTPGRDGGRDLEGKVVVTDIVGTDRLETWYIECKRYNSSIGWPTVWKKVAYADSQGADVFLLATNSNPSPTCETEIDRWNAQKRRPAIRVWRGYSLGHVLATKPHILISHGLSDERGLEITDITALSQLILGVVQSANSRHHFGLDVSDALETGSALSELLEQRLADMRTNGRFGSGHRLSAPPATSGCPLTATTWP